MPERLEDVDVLRTALRRHIKHFRMLSKGREHGVPYTTKDYRSIIQSLELLMLTLAEWVENINATDRLFLLYAAVCAWDGADFDRSKVLADPLPIDHQRLLTEATAELER